MDASAGSGGWRVRVRFTSRDQFDSFPEHFQEKDVSLQSNQLAEPEAARQMFGKITLDQRNTLVAAKERGYYRVPRETTARELAKELDMTQQSVSEFLRKRTKNSIETTPVSKYEGPQGRNLGPAKAGKPPNRVKGVGWVMNDIDAALSILSNTHRRRVLLALLDHNPQTVEELSIPDDTHAGDTEDEGLQLEIYHFHIPKLEATGLIQWDKNDQRVVKGLRFGETKPLLEVLANNIEKPTKGRYVANQAY